ncbi:hypothetical protein HK096_005151 [Nowakowskiella sp. JEL0078]|nr:hypothetical protein HK096_005151 [Nowakowskiella sp. JEL0078]
MKNNQNNPSTSILLKWFEDNGIIYNKNAINIECTEHSTGNTQDMRIVSRRPLKIGENVCTIPIESILSIKNSGITDVLEECQLGGVLGLSIAVMYELLLDEKSPWFGYLQSLPTNLPHPLFWSPDKDHEKSGLELLKGTELEKVIATHRSLLEDDYNTHLKPLIAENSQFRFAFPHPEQMTWDLFCRATALSMSRAFYVNNYHGESLVPFVDIFNHAIHENVHVETDLDTCEICGEYEGCDCMIEVSSNETESTTPSLIENDNDNDSVSPAVLTITVVKECLKNQEVFNTYGKLPNSELLQRYGFALEANIYDRVWFDVEDIIRAVEKVASDKKCITRNRIIWGGQNASKKMENRINRWLENVKIWLEDENHLEVDENHGVDEDHDWEDMSNESHLDEVESLDESFFSEVDDDEQSTDFSPPLYFNFDGSLSKHLIYLIRLLFCTDSAFETLIQNPPTEKHLSKTWHVVTSSISVQSPITCTTSPIQKSIQYVAAFLASERLKKYKSTFAEDLKMLQELRGNQYEKNQGILSISNNDFLRCQEWALILNMGEKNILKKTLHLVE